MDKVLVSECHDKNKKKTQNVEHFLCALYITLKMRTRTLSLNALLAHVRFLWNVFLEL